MFLCAKIRKESLEKMSTKKLEGLKPVTLLKDVHALVNLFLTELSVEQVKTSLVGNVLRFKRVDLESTGLVEAMKVLVPKTYEISVLKKKKNVYVKVNPVAFSVCLFQREMYAKVKKAATSEMAGFALGFVTRKMFKRNK